MKGIQGNGPSFLENPFNHHPLFQTKYSSSHNTQQCNTTDEEDGDNAEARANDVRMATTTANKSHSWRGDHPMKDKNGYVCHI